MRMKTRSFLRRRHPFLLRTLIAPTAIATHQTAAAQLAGEARG
jgi:hypothetical protein